MEKSVSCFSNLYIEDIPHRFGSFFLGGGGDVGVGVRGEAGGEVSEHTTNCLDVHSIL